MGFCSQLLLLPKLCLGLYSLLLLLLLLFLLLLPMPQRLGTSAPAPPPSGPWALTLNPRHGGNRGSAGAGRPSPGAAELWPRHPPSR